MELTVRTHNGRRKGVIEVLKVSESLANTKAALHEEILSLIRQSEHPKPYVDYLLCVDRLLGGYDAEAYTTASTWLLACMKAYADLYDDRQTAIAYLAGAMTCITRGHIGTRLEDILSEALREEELISSERWLKQRGGGIDDQ